MKITIHRGIDQIGGCITEITTAEARIVIDLGQNLPRGDEEVKDNLASKEAIESITSGVDAILYTHIHGDHFGLFNLVPEGIPQYVGKVSKDVSICKLKRLGHIKGREKQTAGEIERVSKMSPIEALKIIQIKDIKITPLFVSHSAYDAFMLLIEADGFRLLHTGDFRSHGYLGKGLIPTIQKHIVGTGPVDILITEGTMVSRLVEDVKHESKLMWELTELFKEKKNVFVWSSSTDLERLATIYSAYKELKRGPFVCDDYQAKILNIFSKSAGAHSDLFKFGKAYTYSDKNRILNDWMKSKGFCMMVRPTEKFSSYVDKILPELDPAETVLIYSMWKEYINPKSEHAKSDYLVFRSKFPDCREIHTSGHASPQCLAEVCNLVNPRLAIIPIHSEKSADFKSLAIRDELKERIITESYMFDNLDICLRGKVSNI
jgi:ribonuclease J